MQLIDTHAHLTDEKLRPQIDAVLSRAAAAGVRQIVCVAVDGAGVAAAADLAASHPGVFAAAGIHPNYAHLASESDWEAVRAAAEEGGAVAVGETGLDRHWDDCPWEVQVANFARHVALSRRTGLPLIIHCRECFREMLALLDRLAGGRPLRGVLHSFTGTAAEAAECVRLGLHVGFAGMLTYKKSADLRDVAAGLPADRLLVETDCPYLSPEPHRGKSPNEPARVVHTSAVLAACRGLPAEEIATLTTANARRLFERIDDSMLPAPPAD